MLDLLNYLRSITGDSEKSGRDDCLQSSNLIDTFITSFFPLVFQKLLHPLHLSPDNGLSILDEGNRMGKRHSILLTCSSINDTFCIYNRESQASSSGNNRRDQLDGHHHDTCGGGSSRAIDSRGWDQLEGQHHGGPSRAMDDMVDSTSDINTIKKGIWDILKESKKVTGMAKKDHHMHLNPITNKGVHILPLSTSLGYNNNNNGQKDSPTVPTLLPASQSSTIPDP